MPSPTPLGATRTELTGLTGIRAVAAGWVVIEHFRLILYALFPGVEGILGPWIRSGFLGVEVFFVLSGFIIAYNYADRFARFSGREYRRFLELRFARIYPVQLATLLVMLVVVLGAKSLNIHLSADENYTPLSFVGNVLNIQALPGISSWNNPAWSISTEFAAYLAFPAIALWLVRLRSARSAFTAAGVILVVGTTAMLVVGLVVSPSPTGEIMIWLRIAFEFTAGCCLYAGWRWLGVRRFGVSWDWVAALSLVALIVALGFAGGGEGALPLATLPLIAVFVLACAGVTGPVGKVLGSRIMLWGGRVSYSVYMTHFIVLMVLGELLPPERFAGDGVIVRAGVLVGYYAVAVAAGAACYYVVEEPARKGIRAALARRANTKPLPVRKESP